MNKTNFPTRGELTVHFAHVAYQLADRFAARNTGIEHFQTWNAEDTRDRLHEADIAVLSGLWSNDLLSKARRLKVIQVCAAGYNQFDLDALAARGVRVFNSSGVNMNAVSEHALALMLSFTRQLHTGRDHQHKKFWRGMISDIGKREDELGGKTILIYGLGAIGSRLARIAKMFDMHVIGLKRNFSDHDGSAHEIHSPERLLELLPHADFVVLCCPLTAETRNVINAEALEAMSTGAYLINVARGACVDEAALIDAVGSGAIAGAGIDTTVEEPLSASSPLWEFENVIVTPHTGGETRAYEDNVIDLLVSNLERLWRAEATLFNQLN